MVALKAKLQAVADKLANQTFVEAKYPITLENAGTDYDPDTGATTGGEIQALKATVVGYRQDQFDGANIKVGDQKVILLNSELTIDIQKGITTFTLDFDGNVTTGKVINTKADPLNITTTLQLRAA